ncbi:MAG: non-canonical purine NTP pyrophosphatase [Cyanobacteria bacterium]|nr:non-canonical purine NTP pyrophosphatase [Cyanobacteriota bacterium]
MTKKPIVVWVASTNPHKLNELQVILRLLKLEQEMVFNIPDNLVDVPETGLTFLDNARIKAEHFVERLRNINADNHDWILAEDSGLIVPALNDMYGYDPFPGVFSNRWMTPTIRDELLTAPMNSDIPSYIDSPKITDIDKNCGILALLNHKMLNGKDVSREARYACAMSLWNLKTEIATAYGEMSLQVRELNEHTFLNESAQAEKNDLPRGFGYDPIMLSVPSMRCLSQMSIEEKSAISHRANAFRQLIALTKRGPAHN